MSVLPPEFGAYTPHSAQSENCFLCNLRISSWITQGSPMKLRDYFSIHLMPPYTNRQLSAHRIYAYFFPSQLLPRILYIISQSLSRGDVTNFCVFGVSGEVGLQLNPTIYQSNSLILILRKEKSSMYSHISRPCRDAGIYRASDHICEP